MLLLLLLTVAYTIIGISLIKHSKNLIEAGEINRDKDNGAPTQAFYDGMSLLSNMRWMPYYGGWAEEIMDVHTGPFLANYLIDYYMFQSENDQQRYFREMDLRDSLRHANDSLYNLLPPLEYSVTDLSTPLPADDQEEFCKKWKRFEQLLKELNEDGAELDLYGNCK